MLLYHWCCHQEFTLLFQKQVMQFSSQWMADWPNLNKLNFCLRPKHLRTAYLLKIGTDIQKVNALLLVKTDLLAIKTLFFIYFSDTPASDSSFRPVETYFWNEFFILASENGFSVWWKPFFRPFFTTNPSFRLLESEFLSSGNDNFSMIAYCFIISCPSGNM